MLFLHISSNITTSTGSNYRVGDKVTVNTTATKRKIYQEIYGEYKEFNPHSLRHSLAQNLKDGTHYLCKKTGGKMDITIIRKLMNHSYVSTTLGYCKEDVLLSIFENKK